MATPALEFRVSNDQAWTREFSILVGSTASPPWTGLPERQPATTYGPSSAMSHLGDAYIARPGLLPSSFTAAASFAGDVDGAGTSRWLKVGEARAYKREPYPIAGADLLFAIVPATSTGEILSPRPALTATSAEGDFVITDAPSATVRLNVAYEKTSSVTPGLYAFAMYALFPDARGRQRLRFGLWLVDQGIAA